MPSLLAVGAVHHHLIRTGLRMLIGIVLESAEPREVMHFACCSATAASAINPYLAIDTLVDMAGDGDLHGHDAKTKPSSTSVKAHRQGHAEDDVQDGHLDARELSRRADLRGHRAQSDEVDRPLLHVDGVAHPAASVSTSRHARVEMRHRRAWRPRSRRRLRPRAGRPVRVAPPRRVPPVQPGDDRASCSTRCARATTTYFKKYAKLVNEQDKQPLHAAQPARLRAGGEHSVPLDEVEPASEIVKRFKTGAM